MIEDESHCYFLIKKYIKNKNKYKLDEHFLILNFLEKINCFKFILSK